MFFWKTLKYCPSVRESLLEATFSAVAIARVDMIDLKGHFAKSYATQSVNTWRPKIQILPRK